MGQEVKNPLRVQSKYGLMGSSAKTGKKIFRGSPEHFLDKNDIWDRTPPHLYINCSLHVWGRVQGSQIFKRNSIISIRSKVMAFLVISLSPWSPHCPHIVPVVPTSSPCHPHIVPIPPEGPHVVSMAVVSVVSVVSTPCCPRGPHVVPTSSPSSPCHPHHPHSPQKVPMWSPWLWSPLSLWSPPHVVPVVSMSSLSSPRRLCVVPVIPTSSRRSPHHL